MERRKDNEEISLLANYAVHYLQLFFSEYRIMGYDQFCQEIRC